MSGPTQPVAQAGHLRKTCRRVRAKLMLDQLHANGGRGRFSPTPVRFPSQCTRKRSTKLTVTGLLSTPSVKVLECGYGQPPASEPPAGSPWTMRWRVGNALRGNSEHRRLAERLAEQEFIHRPSAADTTTHCALRFKAMEKPVSY